jgi:hypothetical protein
MTEVLSLKDKSFKHGFVPLNSFSDKSEIGEFNSATQKQHNSMKRSL